MSESLKTSIIVSAIVSCVAIIALAVCCLAAFGYNSQISVAENKIEVVTENTNSNLTD